MDAKRGEVAPPGDGGRARQHERLRVCGRSTHAVGPTGLVRDRPADRELGWAESASLGYAGEWEVRRDNAQIYGRGGQRAVLLVGPWRGRGPHPVGADALAGARAPAVLGARAGARRGGASRGTDRAGRGVRALRGRGPRDAGTPRRARASGRRWGLPPRPQPDVRG